MQISEQAGQKEEEHKVCRVQSTNTGFQKVLKSKKRGMQNSMVFGTKQLGIRI